jgi:ribosomal protein S8
MRSKFKYLVLEVNKKKDYISSCKVKNQLTEEIIIVLFEDENKTKEMIDIISFIDINDLEVNDEFIKV